MSKKLIKYLNKNKISEFGNVHAILLSKETLTHYYVFKANMKKNDCIIMSEPIDSQRPYCELYHVYFNEIRDIIGEYYIVNGASIDKPYKEVMARLKTEESRLLSIAQ